MDNYEYVASGMIAMMLGPIKGKLNEIEAGDIRPNTKAYINQCLAGLSVIRKEGSEVFEEPVSGANMAEQRLHKEINELVDRCNKIKRGLKQ
jgi:ribosomal protein L1